MLIFDDATTQHNPVTLARWTLDRLTDKPARRNRDLIGDASSPVGAARVALTAGNLDDASERLYEAVGMAVAPLPVPKRAGPEHRRAEEERHEVAKSLRVAGVLVHIAQGAAPANLSRAGELARWVLDRDTDCVLCDQNEGLVWNPRDEDGPLTLASWEVKRGNLQTALAHLNEAVKMASEPVPAVAGETATDHQRAVGERARLLQVALTARHLLAYQMAAPALNLDPNAPEERELLLQGLRTARAARDIEFVRDLIDLSPIDLSGYADRVRAFLAELAVAGTPFAAEHRAKLVEMMKASAKAGTVLDDEVAGAIIDGINAWADHIDAARAAAARAGR